MPTVSSPACIAPALASRVSLPADLTEVSVEPLGEVVGVSRGGPDGSVKPVKASSAVCPSDDLDVTLRALARQLGSSSTAVPHGGEGYPPPSFAEREGGEQHGTSDGTGGEFQKSSPQFSAFLPGFERTFGAQGSSPVPKRGKCIVWL